MKRFVLFLIGAATLTWASPSAGGANSERVMEMITTMRIIRMTEELGLSDQQIASILPRLRERDSVSFQYRMDQATDLDQLEAQISRNNPSEARIGEIVRRMRDRENAYQKKIETINSEIMNNLTVEQQARFIVFEARFEQEIRRLIAQVRGTGTTSSQQKGNESGGIR